MSKVGSVTVDTKALDKLIGELDPRAVKVIAKAATDVETGAKVRAPVLTGALRASIFTAIKNEGLTAEIGPSVEYGVYVELGTGRRGATSNIQRPEGVKYSKDWPGISAHPFLIPALEAIRKSFLEAWKQLVK